MTIAAYQTLYQSSGTFAMRKQIQAEHCMTEQEKTRTMDWISKDKKDYEEHELLN